MGSRGSRKVALFTESNPDAQSRNGVEANLIHFYGTGSPLSPAACCNILKPLATRTELNYRSKLVSMLDGRVAARADGVRRIAGSAFQHSTSPFAIA